jgi:DNA-binding Lrp family transcriptional regulator
MKVKDMPYGEISYWINRVDELKKDGFTKREWCNLGHELMQKHGLSEKVAVRLLHGRIEEAVKLEEFEEKA